MGSSAASDVLLLKLFKTRWQYINKTTYEEDSSNDEYVANAVADSKDEMVQILETAVIVT